MAKGGGIPKTPPPESKILENPYSTFGSIISTKTNVVVKILLEHCFLKLSAVYDYVSDIIDVVIQIHNPTLLHVKLLQQCC